ncbi:porin family protein [Hymenobacter sp. BT635]|uniref:Porin family protein n=1 Tax=Hymenobacter nitidus TaxID=2880929 RepID=A0ABS8A9J1_9BACT|nr:porin family protein [Hymenobacter nitidus]MCB2376054.1 porin family protein [Hymenobacter nitidus]
MRTPDMSDEELDALFQRGAENYPDEHNLSAWLQMERKLDAAAAEQLVRQRVLRMVALEAVLLLVALLVWFGVFAPSALPPLASATLTSPSARQLEQTIAARRQTALPAAATNRPTPAREPAAAPVAPLVAADVASTSMPASASLPTPTTQILRYEHENLTRPRRKQLLAALPVNPGRQPAVGFQHEVRAAVRPASAAPAAVQASEASGGAVSSQHPSPTQFSLGVVNPISPTLEHAASLLPGSGQGISIRENSPVPPASAAAPAETVAPEAAVAAAARPGSEPLPDRTSGATQPDSTAPAASAVATNSAIAASSALPADSSREKAPRARPAYRLSIGVLYAPELSAVGWANGPGLGSNLGVQLEYRLTDRLRLTAAALRSVKRYAARGSDYHPPTGYWTNNHDYTINQVDAVCRITDVPLNLRYDALRRPNAAAFASIGLSTLLMRNEQYRYAYEYYGKPAERTWSLAKGSNHYLSVLNLSVGYEHRLPGRWSVQGEPFMKIPLGGVGFGKVKLSSAGVFLGLKYNLLPTAPDPR